MSMDRRELLAKERVGRLLWRLSVPAVIGMLVQASYNIVDAIFIGRGVGPLGLAGTTIVFPIQLLASSLAVTIGVGGASIISRSLGAKKYEKANRALGNMVFLSLIFSTTILITGSLAQQRLLRLFGASPTILPYAEEYLQVILMGLPFVGFGMSLNHAARSEGNARVAMISMIISAVMNMILDPIFIFVLNMGIRGAAIATVISQIAMACWMGYYFLLSGNSFLVLALRYGQPQLEYIKEILSVGAAEFVRMASGSMIIVFINNSLIHYGSDISVAVYGILHRALSFSFLPIVGVSQGLQPILGFNYGAGRYDRARDVARLAIIAASCIAFCAFMVGMFFPEKVVRLFTTDLLLIKEASASLRIVITAYFLVGFQITGSSMFQALGKGRASLILSLTRQVIFFLPCVVILPRFFLLKGIWLAFPTADALAFLVTVTLVSRQLGALKMERSEQNQ
jgi:putative MATE family efflux protein